MGGVESLDMEKMDFAAIKHADHITAGISLNSSQQEATPHGLITDYTFPCLFLRIPTDIEIIFSSKAIKGKVILRQTL